jgi:LmbE family N-acetylglucosaminyl deacetylase
MNVLVIAPHPDDETLGCGGALCLHQRRGEHTAVVWLTSGELGLKRLPRRKAWAIREQEARAAARILGVTGLHFLRQPDWKLDAHINETAASLRRVIEEEQPHLIYVAHDADAHPDHRASRPILQQALSENHGTRPSILTYEVWTPLATHDQFQDISAVMPRKVRALRAHASQLEEFQYERAVRGLNAFRGELGAKCRYAEVFQSVTWKHVPATPEEARA